MKNRTRSAALAGLRFFIRLLAIFCFIAAPFVLTTVLDRVIFDNLDLSYDAPATIHREYEVLSVEKQTEYTTNMYGRIMWTDEYYEVTIIGSSGGVESVDYDGEIKLGDKDLYVVENPDGAAIYSRCLYLTKETLKGL